MEKFKRYVDMETASKSGSSDDMEMEDYYSSICDDYGDTWSHHRSTKLKAVHIVKV